MADDDDLSFVTEYFVPHIKLSTKLTEPQAFNLATDHRAKRRRTVDPDELPEPPRGQQTKRHRPQRNSVANADIKWKPAVTVPQDFNLPVDARSTLKLKRPFITAESDLFESTSSAGSIFCEEPVTKAQEVALITGNRPNKRASADAADAPAAAKPLTVPQSPAFATRSRTRLRTDAHAARGGTDSSESAHDPKRQPPANRRSEPMTDAPLRVTEPVAFPLQTEQRGQLSSQLFESRVAQEKQEEEKRRQFKARPVPITEPFVPQRSTKPLTVLSDAQLNSENRAERRKIFDDTLSKKMSQAEEERKKREADMKEHEAREIALLRKQMEFKANPIVAGRPIEIKPSAQPITTPFSPRLRTKTRNMRAL